MMKGSAGRMTEIWRLTGDASATSVVVTSDFISRVITCVVGGGPAASHNITAATGKAVTITFATAPAAVSFDVRLEGKISS